MNLVYRAFSPYLKSRLRVIQNNIDHPFTTQRTLLKQLITEAAATVWGQRYDYKSINDPHTYSNRIPITDYETLKPFIKRMMDGEPDVLWPGITRQFAKSSGTSNDKSKYIPLTRSSLIDNHLKGGRDTIALWFNENPSSQLLTGKTMLMGGSLGKFAETPRTIIGDISALMIKNTPWWISLFKSPDRRTALLADWRKKVECMARQATRERITGIAGVPSWTLVLFKKILELTGAHHILEVMPKLELYIHGGVSFAPYKEQFATLLPNSTFSYREVYNASEGYFASGYKDLLLFLNHGVYYEFIPMDEFDRESSKTFTLEEVELGKNYAIIISTNSGLWRYRLGDTVEFRELNPFKIRITGRTQHHINAFGEEVMVANADAALATACHATQSSIVEYTAAPLHMSTKSTGRHEWFIEFEKPPPDLGTFTQLLDEALKSVNSDYEAKRSKNLVLQEPLVRSLAKGTFHGWLESKKKYGGQNKVPRLSNSRQYLEGLNSWSSKN